MYWTQLTTITDEYFFKYQYLSVCFCLTSTGAQTDGPQRAVGSIRQTAPTARRQQGVYHQT